MDNYEKINAGLIITMDENNSVIFNGSIEVEDGKIKSISGRQTPDNYMNHDNSRKVIIPGLVNAHTHLFMSMFRGLSDSHELFPWLKTVSPFIRKQNEEDIIQSTYIGAIEALQSGTTTICECCRTDPNLTGKITSEVGLRSISGGMAADEGLSKHPQNLLPELKNNTRKLMNNYENYKGLATVFIGVHSPYNCSPDFIKHVKQLSSDFGIPFNIHLAECKAELEVVQKRYGKTSVKHLHDLDILDSNVIADHCVWFTDEDLEIFANSGAGIVHNPISNVKLKSGTAPIKKYLDAGVPVALGTDSVVSNNSLNMFEEMKFAMLLQRVVSTIEESNSLSEYDILKMGTILGAKVLGLDQKIGSLEIGKCADFLVIELPSEMQLNLDRALSHLIYSLAIKDIQLVFVDGEPVVIDGNLQLIDDKKKNQELKIYFENRWEQIDT